MQQIARVRWGVNTAENFRAEEGGYRARERYGTEVSGCVRSSLGDTLGGLARVLLVRGDVRRELLPARTVSLLAHA